MYSCINVYMLHLYIYIRDVYIFIYINIYKSKCEDAQTYTYTYILIYTYTCMNQHDIYIYICSNMYIHIYTYIYVNNDMYVYVCVISIYINCLLPVASRIIQVWWYSPQSHLGTQAYCGLKQQPIHASSSAIGHLSRPCRSRRSNCTWRRQHLWSTLLSPHRPLTAL